MSDELNIGAPAGIALGPERGHSCPQQAVMTSTVERGYPVPDPAVAADKNVRAPAQCHFFVLLIICAVSLLCGCAGSRVAAQPTHRAFEFRKDTFAFPNELVWDYMFETNGNWTAKRHVPAPTYKLHCLVLARSCRQFFENARFEPDEPKADAKTYRALVRRVIGANPRKPLPEAEKVRIPGYANLREFSVAEQKLLKAECGGAWESYFARGNWRMIFPFSRHEQENMAGKLMEHLRPEHPLVVHISRFPKMTVNHTVLIFDACENKHEIRFAVYDPNVPAEATTLVFDRATRTFLFPQTLYFPGGRVDTYEMFHRWNY